MAVDELDRAIQVAAEAADPSELQHMPLGFIHSEQNELNPAFERLNDAAQAFQSVGLPITILETIAADLRDGTDSRLRQKNGLRPSRMPSKVSRRHSMGRCSARRGAL